MWTVCPACEASGRGPCYKQGWAGGLDKAALTRHFFGKGLLQVSLQLLGRACGHQGALLRTAGVPPVMAICPRSTDVTSARVGPAQVP